MINRRHIRIKVMQTIYAFQHTTEQDVDKQQKFLFFSIENIYNLYLLQLNLLIELRAFAEEQLILSQKKYLATAQEKNPNKKFIQNKILVLLSENNLLKERIKNKKINHSDTDHTYIKTIYETLLQSDWYTNYMQNNTNTFEDDQEFIINIYKEIIAPNEKLYHYIEDHQLTWVDDFPVVNTIILRILERTNSNSPNTHFLPNIYKDEEDKEFAKTLFLKTVLNHQEFQNEIAGKTPNWDTDRIAHIDAILIKMAICEFLKFPSIPVKVTINEYLEIAKEYATPKSSLFINGVLDKLVKEYQQNNKLNKSGRGLL